MFREIANPGSMNSIRRLMTTSFGSKARPFSPLIKEMIVESSRKCFDNLPIVPYRTGNKLLRQKPIGPMAIQYYHEDQTKSWKKMSPDFQTEYQERRADSLYNRQRRGKGPPKKGQGKRLEASVFLLHLLVGPLISLISSPSVLPPLTTFFYDLQSQFYRASRKK